MASASQPIQRSAPTVACRRPSRPPVSGATIQHQSCASAIRATKAGASSPGPGAAVDSAVPRPPGETSHPGAPSTAQVTRRPSSRSRSPTIALRIAAPASRSPGSQGVSWMLPLKDS